MKNKYFMPLDIQRFAEGSTEPVTRTDENTEGQGTEPVKVTEPKTFTQEEVNSMLAKERRNMPSKEDLKEFNEWKDSRKTNEEKFADVVKENEDLKKQLSYANNTAVVANAGVDAKFQKFVLSEINDMEGEFEDNLKQYLKDNPQYLLNKEEKKGGTTGVSQNGTNKPVSDAQAYLDKKYAKNPYYKK